METNNTNDDKDKEKVLDAFVGALKKQFEENQERPHQYVVQYLRVADDSLIGYHASSFCQVTDDVFSGKRYSGENPYSQLATIFKNLKSVLETTEDDTDLFGPIRFKIKEAYFKDLTIDDVYIEAEYLDEDAPKQTFKFTKLDNSKTDE